MKYKLVKKIYKKIIAGSSESSHHICRNKFTDGSYVVIKAADETSCGIYSKDSTVYHCHQDIPFDLDQSILARIFFQFKISQPDHESKCHVTENSFGLSLSEFLNNRDILISELIEPLDMLVEQLKTSDILIKKFLQIFIKLIQNIMPISIHSIQALQYTPESYREQFREIFKLISLFETETGIDFNSFHSLFTLFAKLIMKLFCDFIFAIADQITRIYALLFVNNYMYNTLDDRHYLVVIEDINRPHLGIEWTNNRFGRKFIFIYLSHIEFIQRMDILHKSRVRVLIFKNSKNPLSILITDHSDRSPGDPIDVYKTRNISPTSLSITPLLLFNEMEIEFTKKIIELTEMIANPELPSIYHFGHVIFTSYFLDAAKVLRELIVSKYLSYPVFHMQLSSNKLLLDKCIADNLAQYT